MSKRYTVNILGVRATGTLREWVTEMVGGTLLLMAFGVLYVFLTVVV